MHESSIDRASPLFCLNANLRKASRQVLSKYMEDIGDSGLQGTQFTLLTTISGFKQAKIGQLASFMSMDQTTVTRNVNVLKREGYVEVVPGEDRRTRIVRLTSAGEAIIEETYPKWLAAQTKLWDRFGEEKAIQLLGLLQEIGEIA